jgi:hypothetical protein
MEMRLVQGDYIFQFTVSEVVKSSFTAVGLLWGK